MEKTNLHEAIVPVATVRGVGCSMMMRVLAESAEQGLGASADLRR